MKQILTSAILAAFMFSSTTFAHADQKENEWVICSSTWVTNFGPTDFHVDNCGTNIAITSFTPKPGWTLVAPVPNPVGIQPRGGAPWAVIKGLESSADGFAWYCEYPETRGAHKHKKAPTLRGMDVYWTEQYFYSPTTVQVNLHARVLEASEGFHQTPVKFGPCECGHVRNPTAELDDEPKTHFNKYTWRWDNMSNGVSWLQIEVPNNLFNPTFTFPKSGDHVLILVQVLAEWTECEVAVPIKKPYSREYAIADNAKACHDYKYSLCSIVPDPSIPPYVIPFP